MNRLTKALSQLIGDDELTAPLAAVLANAYKGGRVSYGEVEKIVGDNLEEVLLFGNKWRLLIPARIVKSSAWEDRPLVCKPGEWYELPNAVRYLIQKASKTGCWDPVYAITQVFKEMEEPAWQQMPQLVEELGRQGRDYRISAAEIRQICTTVGLRDRVDVLIAELKSTGVMSPKLSSLAEASRAGSPFYELNPSLVMRKGEQE